MGKQASSLGLSSGILSCRKKASTRHWKTQFTCSINRNSYVTQDKHTPVTHCTGLTWTVTDVTLFIEREYTAFSSLYIMFKCKFYFFLTSPEPPDCSSISVRPEVLGQRVTHSYSVVVSWMAHIQAWGAFNMCTLACSWQFSDPNTCWLGRQCGEGKGRIWNTLQGWGRRT